MVSSAAAVEYETSVDQLEVCHKIWSGIQDFSVQNMKYQTTCIAVKCQYYLSLELMFHLSKLPSWSNNHLVFHSEVQVRLQT